MGEINISRSEKDALKAIDSDELNRLIQQCCHDERSGPLRSLRLENCGPYVASQLRELEAALLEHSQAKAAKKRAQTECRVDRASRGLVYAVQQMQTRVEAEEKDGLLFYIEDQVIPPGRFNEHLIVRIYYRWRRAIEDKWISGSITFVYDVDLRPDYMRPLSARKPIAAKQEQVQQNKLYHEWEHLMKLGLYSVRDYFKGGGSGAEIPKTFQVRVDPHSRGLNNYSTDFWR